MHPVRPEIRRDGLIICDEPDDAVQLASWLESQLSIAVSIQLLPPDQVTINALSREQWAFIVCDFDTQPALADPLFAWKTATQSNAALIFLSDNAPMREVVDGMRRGAQGFVGKREYSRLLEIILAETGILPAADDDQTKGWLLARNAFLVQSLDLIAMADLDGEIILINQSGVTMMEASSASDIVGMNVRECHPAAAAEQLFRDNLPQALEKGFWRGETQILTLSGRLVEAYQTLIPIHNQQGELTYIATIISDITERKRADEWLRESETKYRILAENMADVIWILDTTTMGFTYVSPSVRQLRGFTPEEVMRQSLARVITPASLESFGRDLARRIEAFSAGDLSAVSERYEVEQFRKDHSTVWTEIATTLIRDETGSVQVLAVSRDISERREYERQLLASQARLADAQRIARIGNWFWNLTNHQIQWSDQTYHIFGFQPQQFAVNHDMFLNLVHPDDRTRVQNAIRDAIHSHTNLSIDHRIVCADQHVRYVHQEAEIEYDKTDQAVAVFGTMQDVTRQTQAEEAIRVNEQRLRSLINSQTSYVLRTDLRGYHRYWNPKYEQDFGWLFNQGMADSFSLDSVLDYHHERARITVAACIAEPGKIVTVELDKPLADGSVRSTLWEFVCLTDDQGKPYEVQCMGLDITDRVRAERSQRQAETRYRRMFEDVRLPKLIIDPATGAIVDANRAATAFYGYPPEQLEKMYITEIDVQPSESSAPVIEGIRSIRQRLADQSVRDVEIYSTQIDIEGEQMLYCLYIDVTERNQARAALQETLEKLEQRVIERTIELERSNDQLAAIIRHSADAILLLSVDDGILQANYAFEDAFRIGAQDYTGARISTFFQSAHDVPIDTCVDQVASSHRSQQIEAYASLPDGTSAIFEISIAPVNRSEKAVHNIVCIARDITERKQIEVIVRESEKHYRITVNSMSEGLIVLNANGSVQFCNEAAERILGLSNQQIAGSAQVDPAWYATLDDGSTFSTQAGPAQLALKTGEAQSNVVIGIHKPDGNLTWVLSNHMPLMNQEGTVYTVISTLTDISDLKQAEAALQAKRSDELKMQWYLKNLHEVGLQLTRTDNLDDFYRCTVEQGLKRFGFERMGLLLYDKGKAYGTYGTNHKGEVIPEYHIVLNPEDLTGILMQTLDRSERFAYEPRTQLYDNLTYIGEGSNAVATLWDGVALGWLAIDNGVQHRPISELQLEVLSLYALTVGSLLARKRSEQHAMRLSQRLELATRAGGIGIWEWRIPEDRMIWDEGMDQIFGYTPEDRQNVTHWRQNFLHPADLERFEEEVNGAMRNGGSLNSEYRIIHASGETHFIQCSARVLQDRYGVPERMVGANIDITSLKLAEESLRTSLEKEKELGDLKSRFVSTASHEFRTPLAVILSTAETLSTYRERMDTAQIDARLDKIRSQVMHMKEIMDDVLQLTRMQTGKLDFRPVITHIGTLCQEIIDEFEAQKDYSGRIVYECQQEILTSVFDPRLMRQVITNLVHNALKYSAVEKQVHIHLSQDSEQVTLSIRDQGIGIPEADLPRLFEPFHRAANVGKISGTGLGLSISKQAIELHGGTLTLESTEGVGSTFIIALPNMPVTGMDHHESDSEI